MVTHGGWQREQIIISSKAKQSKSNSRHPSSLSLLQSLSSHEATTIHHNTYNNVHHEHDEEAYGILRRALVGGRRLLFGWRRAFMADTFTGILLSNHKNNTTLVVANVSSDHFIHDDEEEYSSGSYSKIKESSSGTCSCVLHFTLIININISISFITIRTTTCSR
jgi:hypothetical protein